MNTPKWDDLFATAGKPKAAFDKKPADGVLVEGGFYGIKLFDFKTLITKAGNPLLILKGRTTDENNKTAFIDGMYSLDGADERIQSMQSDMMYKLATALGLDIVEIATNANNDSLEIFKAVGTAAKAKTIYASAKAGREYNGKTTYQWNNFTVSNEVSMEEVPTAPVKTTDAGQLADEFDF